MAKINWTVEAETWLADIFAFIAQENPKAARNVVRSIYDKVQVLQDFPEIGYQYRIEKEGEIRIMLYGHYRIAYMVRNLDQIDILGVFHGAMDIDQYFNMTMNQPQVDFYFEIKISPDVEMTSMVSFRPTGRLAGMQEVRPQGRGR